MVFRMIVPEVLVDVQRRHRGRRYDQGLHQRECDESAHEDSLPEAAPSTVRQATAVILEEWQECVVHCRTLPVNR